MLKIPQFNFQFFFKNKKMQIQTCIASNFENCISSSMNIAGDAIFKFVGDAIACPAPKILQIENCSSFSLLENCFTRAKSGRHSTKPALLWEFKGNWVPAFLLIRHKHRKLSSKLIFWIFCLRSRANSCQRFRFGTNVAGRPCECGFGWFGV